MTFAIEIDHLSKRFVRPLPALRRLLRRPGPDVVHALTEVNLAVPAGEVFGLVGRNGQGKTTLIKSACGLLEPTEGRVRIFGYDTVRDIREVKRRVGLVSADERSFYYRLTGRQNLAFFARLHRLAAKEIEQRIEALASTFELGPVLDRRFQEYSTGNKQRLAIVRALLPDPPLLLLDEPTRSLDPISAQGLRDVIRGWVQGAPEKTVLITTHNLSEVEELCARVAIVSRGQLIECATLAELREKYAGEERVTVRLRGRADPAFFERIRRQLGECELLGAGDEDPGVAFRRRRGDGRLHALLGMALEAGLTVDGCDTEHFGLMQVLARIEAQESAR